MNFQSSIVNFPLMKSVPIELSILNDISHNPIKFNNITNIFIVFPAVLSCRAGMEAQHAAPHNDVSHIPITINNITNIFIVFPGVFSCRVGMEAQHAAPLLTWDVQQINSMKSGLNEFSIVNCPLFRPNGGGVKRSTERSVKKSRLSERSEFSEILAQRPRP